MAFAELRFAYLLNMQGVPWMRFVITRRKKYAKRDFDKANSKGWPPWEFQVAQDVQRAHCCDQTSQYPEQSVAVGCAKHGVVCPDCYRCHREDIRGPARKEQPGCKETAHHRNGTFRDETTQWITSGGWSAHEKLARDEHSERKDKHAAEEDEGESRADSSALQHPRRAQPETPEMNCPGPPPTNARRLSCCASAMSISHLLSAHPSTISWQREQVSLVSVVFLTRCRLTGSNR
jgi:hypothetical protein